MKENIAELIRRRPQDFCVCNGCRSILRSTAFECPQCNAYNPVKNKPDYTLQILDGILNDGQKSVGSEDLS